MDRLVEDNYFADYQVGRKKGSSMRPKPLVKCNIPSSFLMYDTALQQLKPLLRFTVRA